MSNEVLASASVPDLRRPAVGRTHAAISLPGCTRVSTAGQDRAKQLVALHMVGVHGRDAYSDVTLRASINSVKVYIAADYEE